MEKQGPFWEVLRGEAPAPPVSQLLGWKPLSVDPEQRTFSAAFELDHQFTNPMGNVQGGIIAAMLDDAIGPAIVSTLGPNQFAPTAELSVQFLSPARPGTFRADARVIKTGRTIAFVEADLFDADETHIARAHTTVVLQGPHD
ncbi:PaaI family thioesterase [Dietzia timorensis]|uniref:PaaI family thioesterase n=1 Tax=Dietzia timorensis TaxID=499555 RepID=UPI00096AB149|nr:PaaI family thioesterase [Dietzia timorensis]